MKQPPIDHSQPLISAGLPEFQDEARLICTSIWEHYNMETKEYFGVSLTVRVFEYAVHETLPDGEKAWVIYRNMNGVAFPVHTLGKTEDTLNYMADLENTSGELKISGMNTKTLNCTLRLAGPGQLKHHFSNFEFVTDSGYATPKRVLRHKDYKEPPLT